MEFINMTNLLVKHLRQNDRVIVGVSGGPDSTFLLMEVVGFFKDKNAIVVAHVNHGVRGKEAYADEKFVQNLAKAHGLKFEVKRVKLAGKSGMEEKGRTIRREFFEKLRVKYGAKWILTAHTEDDNVETIIFNFLRGAGLAGLSGMKIVDGAYLKPLLHTSKSEILADLKVKKAKFCIDCTNADTKYSRNLLRLKILPLLAKINPSFKKTLVRNGAIFAQIDTYIKAQARDFLDNMSLRASAKQSSQESTTDGDFPKIISFLLKNYKALPEAIATEVIQEVYRRGMKTRYSLPYVKLQEITGMLSKGIGNKKIACGGGGCFALNQGIVKFAS